MFFRLNACSAALTEYDIDTLHQAVSRCTSAYQRQLLTETEFNYRVFSLFIDALIDNPDAAFVRPEFARLADATKSHFEYMLRRLPCEGGYWDWPPGGILANPGGVVAWQTPIPGVQHAIAALRQCVTEYWEACGKFRDVAPGDPVKHRRPPRTREDLRRALVLWSKGILEPGDVLGSVIDCFNEHEMSGDWGLCEECDRERIRTLLETYRPSEIPLGIPGPPDREWQEERERKYLILLGLLGLEPSVEWTRTHQSVD